MCDAVFARVVCVCVCEREDVRVWRGWGQLSHRNARLVHVFVLNLKYTKLSAPEQASRA